jgi:hypothetical protein
VRYTLGPPEDVPELPEAFQHRFHGGYLLAVGTEDGEQPLGFLGLRPRLAAGVAELVRTCRQRGVQLGVFPGRSSEAARVLARRAEVHLLAEHDPVEMIRAGQMRGARVAVVSDSADAGRLFAACDLAIGISTGRSGIFPARADLLVPDLFGVAAIVEAAACRDLASRDAAIISAVSNVFGAFWGFMRQPGVERASLPIYIASLTALAVGRLRLRGGERPRSGLAYLLDRTPSVGGGARPRPSCASCTAAPTASAVPRPANARAAGRRPPGVMPSSPPCSTSSAPP